MERESEDILTIDDLSNYLRMISPDRLVHS